MWTPAYGQSKARRPARTDIQQLCEDTGCNPEDLPEAMNDRETWRKRGSGISVLAARHDDDDDDDSILTDEIFSCWLIFTVQVSKKKKKKCSKVVNLSMNLIGLEVVFLIFLERRFLELF